MKTSVFYAAAALFVLMSGLFAPVYAAIAVYTLNADDEIKLTVFGEDSLSGTYRLDAGGAVSVPLIGEVVLRGLNARQAESLIRERLMDGYLVDPDVVIEISRYKPVYVLGEVQAPGRYDYAGDMSALNAVALAGGFTYRADRKTVRIVSGGDRSREAALTEILKPGDVVTVEERLF